MSNISVSEWVSYCHPDKIADRISACIVDAYIAADPDSRCGVETMVKDNIVVVGGEVCSKATVNIDLYVRSVIHRSPFPASHNFTPDSIKIINLLGQQSPEIHAGVDNGDILGAGDQGMMLGYATNETPTMMPLQLYLAKAIGEAVVSYNNIGNDAKTQVVIERDENNVPKVNTILVSSMHECSLAELRKTVIRIIAENKMGIPQHLHELLAGCDYQLLINPCGEWHTGGSIADCGMTGRKIAVDNYGSTCPVGGGAFSGKDASKVDLSGAWMARYLAKNIVRAQLADTCQVELSYAIGVEQPTSISIKRTGGETLATDENIAEWIKFHVDLSPAGIIERFDGALPRMYYCATHGHFGVTDNALQRDFIRNCYPWEITDIAAQMAHALH